MGSVHPRVVVGSGRSTLGSTPGDRPVGTVGVVSGPSLRRRPWAALVRRRRPLTLAALVVVTLVAAQTEPRPGLQGTGLAVSLGLAAVLTGGGALLLRPPDRTGPRSLLVAQFVVVAAGSLVLVWVEPNGAGYFGGFVVAGAAVWLPARTGATVVGVLTAGLAVAGLLGVQRPLLQITLSLVGVVAVYRLGVHARALRRRTEESERLLAELERSRADQLRAATLAEQQRLAREMHDVLAHSMSGLVLHLEAARLLAVRGGAEPRLADTIERAHHLARSGLGEVREAIGTLRGGDLPGPERLAALAAEYERDTGVPCACTVTGEAPELPVQVRLTLYRVAQEALTNIRKHARPHRAELRLDHAPDGTRLTVTDHSQRADQPPPDDQGYGIGGMRERAELLGGRLTAGPTPDGFRVELWAPR
jgi:signal transduction histidine kinase